MSPDAGTQDVTRLLADWQGGDDDALARLMPIVYEELRRVARAHLRGEGSDHTLETAALVHEAYLRLVGLDRMTLQNRTHFFAMAARLMREILVDHARRKNAIKRGGGLTIVGLEDVAAAGAGRDRGRPRAGRGLDRPRRRSTSVCPAWSSCGSSPASASPKRRRFSVSRRRRWNAIGRSQKRGCCSVFHHQANH